MGIVVRRPAARAQGKHLKLQVSLDGPSARVAPYPEKCASNVTLDENKNIVHAMCGTPHQVLATSMCHDSVFYNNDTFLYTGLDVRARIVKDS